MGERRIIAFLAFVSVLVAFGIDTVLPAFDEIRDAFNLGSGSSRLSLIVTTYFVGLSVGQLFYGPLADRFGRQPVLKVGLAIYAGGALAASAAPSMNWLLGARFIWGLGAACAAVIFTAMARDLYDGDRLARILQLVLAVFLLGPIVAPALGELLLLSGWWPIVFVVPAGMAGVAAFWAQFVGETLPLGRRRPLNPRDTVAAFRAVFSNRATVGYMLLMAFSEGAFYVFLGSGQPIVDEIYNHAEIFALLFAVVAGVMALGLLLAARLTPRLGAQRVVAIATIGMLCASVAGTAVALEGNGVPSLWIWGPITTVGLTCMTVLTPTGMSLALDPLGAVAGTAASVVGFVAHGVGALLAALIDRRIDDTVTPMSVGAVLYACIGLAALVLARSAPLSQPTSNTRIA